VSSDRGTTKKVWCCGHGGYCNGFQGHMDTYMCHCACHTPTPQPVNRKDQK